MSSPQVAKLLQAVQHFNETTKGAELPKGVKEAVEGLHSALGTPVPGRDTPGAREVAKLSPRNGTGEHFTRAVTGPDQPSPGQREALSVSQQIEQAAAEIAGKAA